MSEWATRATTAERERDDARALLRDVEWVYHGVADELTERVRRAEKAEQAVRGIYNDLARYLPQVGTETLEDRVREAAAAQTELDALREALSCAPDETPVARARVVRSTNDELLRLLTEARTRIAELEALRATAPTDALTVEQIAERCGLVRGEWGWHNGKHNAIHRAAIGWDWNAGDGLHGKEMSPEAALRAYASAKGIDLGAPTVVEAPQPAPSGGRKDDSGKPSWTLLPWTAVASVVAVLDYGARKYDRDNWRKVPNARQRYSDAALRHIVAWLCGEVNDSESGLPHLAHAACCVLFLLEIP